MWLLLWVDYSFMWIMISYFVWTIIWLLLLIIEKIWNKFTKDKKTPTENNNQIPFAPFLAIGIFVSLFMFETVMEHYDVFVELLGG